MPFSQALKKLGEYWETLAVVGALVGATTALKADFNDFKQVPAVAKDLKIQHDSMYVVQKEQSKSLHVLICIQTHQSLQEKLDCTLNIQ